MHNPRVIRCLAALCAAVFLANLAAGCSPSARKDRQLERAQKHFDAGRYDVAEIEYMNVLRLEPTNYAAIRDLGIMSYHQGRLPRALEFLNRAKLLDTNDIKARLHLGLAGLALGGYEEARQEAEFILDRQPTNGMAMLLFVDSSAKTNGSTAARQRLAALEAMAGNIPEFHVALGSLALRDRNLDAAEASFERAVALGPKSSLAHGAMANLYALRNDRPKAKSAFKTASDLAPARSAHRIRYANFEAAAGDTNAALQVLEEISKEAPDYLPALLRQAEFALAARELQKCERLLSSVLQRDAVSLNAMQLRTELRVAQGDLPKALTELEQCIKVYPRLPQLHYRKAVICLANDDLPGAVTGLNRALALQPDFPEASMLLAQINIRKGDVDSAIKSLTAVLQNRQALVPAQLLLATAYRARGNLDGALNIYLGMTRTLTNSAQPFLLAGLVQRQQSKNADARRSFERALELSSESLAPLEQLVDLDLEEKRFDAARGRVQRVIEHHPNAPQPFLLLAKVHLSQTNRAEAEVALLKAVELAPNFQAAQQLLAHVYVVSGRYEQALEGLQEVVSQNTNDIGSWFQIAQIQSSVSNHAAAKQTYETILRINPRFRPALNNLAWLYAEHLGDLDRAFDLANKARTSYPDDPHTADTLGWICHQRGDYARALGLIQQSADKLPDQPEVLFHLGMTHYMLGEEASARLTLQNALQLDHQAAWRAQADERLQALAFDPAAADAQSVRQLEKWLEERPGEPPLLVRMAAIREREGSWDKAATAYEASLKANPNLVSSLVPLAQIYSAKLNNSQEALKLARRARSLSPEDPLIAHTLGVLAYKAADHTWAFNLLSDSARKLPNDLEVQYDFAWAAYSVGQESNAVMVMRQVLEAGPSVPRYQAAKTFLEMNALSSSPDEAVKFAAQVKELIGQQPDYVPALMANGIILEQKGDFASASDAYNRVLERTPLFSPANKRLAVLYFDRLRDPDKAYNHALKARDAFPEDPAVARVLGILEYKRGRFDRASQLLTEASAKTKEDGDVLYHLGMAQFKLKRGAESKATLTRALAMAPDSSLATEAKKILAELR